MRITIDMGEYDERPSVETLLTDLSEWLSLEGSEQVAKFTTVEGD